MPKKDEDRKTIGGVAYRFVARGGGCPGCVGWDSVKLKHLPICAELPCAREHPICSKFKNRDELRMHQKAQKIVWFELGGCRAPGLPFPCRSEWRSDGKDGIWITEEKK